MTKTKKTGKKDKLGRDIKIAKKRTNLMTTAVFRTHKNLDESLDAEFKCRN